MPKFTTSVIWCKEKPFCAHWEWNPRRWLLGFYRVPYDGLRFWALQIGPLSFHNDYAVIEYEEDTPE